MAVPTTWDLDYDVVVAGYGFAGGWSAIAAHDEGAKVAIFEKMEHFGGNSILSGGGCSCATDHDGALAYLRATNLDATDDEVLQTYAREMMSLKQVMTEFAQEVGFDTMLKRGGGTYPFPGHEQFEVVRFTVNESFKGFSWTNAGRNTVAALKAGNARPEGGGAVHFWILHEHVTRRGIDQFYNAPVNELIVDEDGAVIGVKAEVDGRPVNVRARKGVVLATGGFEHNARLIAHYMQIRHAYSMSPLGNTGDGVLMAQKVGAALWHMWHVHGSYGIKVPDSPVAYRTPFGGYRSDTAGITRRMPWVVVDRFGRRFMNEWPPAAADTPLRDLEKFDFTMLDYPRIPAYMIFDEEARKQGPIANPLFNDEHLTQTLSWSQDNLAEVAKGYLVRRESIQEIAAHWKIDPRTLTETIERWNRSCELGVDSDHGRTPATMMPIKTPPFYTIPVSPIITNTQGGPAHDARQRVIDPYGNPIPRLYVAGELGSIWGHVYLLSGNVLECIIGGRIAGRDAAASAAWVDPEAMEIAVGG